MSYITTSDGTQLFYKDWGPRDAQPIVFSHGWPLSSDAWDRQMLFMLKQGYRVIAHDRRGHGRSDQTDIGNDMDTYADDLAMIMKVLDLHDAILVGHSTGGGEVVHYISRHTSHRVLKIVLVSAVPPIMISTPEWPGGLDIAIFDSLRKELENNRSDFYFQLAIPFFGFNRNGANINEGLRQSFWQQGMMGGIVGQYACIHEFSEVDYTSDLRHIDVPTLVIHGDDDQIVPIGHAGQLTAGVIADAKLLVYRNGPHGLAATHGEQLNIDLLAFAKG
jgi:non-heme chloroperoxidase